MNRLAIISDIHSNLHALEAVLARLADFSYDRLLCLGDIVGYGPHPDRCLDLVLRHCASIVQGNHDLAVIDPYSAQQFNGPAKLAIRWTRERLGPLHIDALYRLPKLLYLNQRVMCVHDSPIPGPTDYIHDRAIAALAFLGVDRHVCLLGHTHVPMVFEAPTLNPEDRMTALDLSAYAPQDGLAISLEPDRRYICNPGSVGQPRDADPRASFGILDLDARTFTVHRQEYDVAAAQRATQRAGLPTILADRLALGA